MKLNFVNQSTAVSADDFTKIVGAQTKFVPLVTKTWALADVKVTSGIPDATASNVFIVDKFPHPQPGALGFHDFLNGAPVAYILGAHHYGALGIFYKGLIVKGKRITPDRYRPGVASVVAHEVAEMLIDPDVKARRTDALGRKWYLEIADHTSGNFLIDGVVMPDFTNPSFYDLKGVKPFSYLNIPTAPFTLVKPGGYGYQDVNGHAVKI